MKEIKQRLAEVRNQIRETAQKVGRDPSEIKLVAVSKTRNINEIKQVIEEDVINLGESRVQELRDKYDSFDQSVKWHMIGHLQRNKVKYLSRMDDCELIHSLDSLRLAKKINKRAKMENRKMKVLVQVNTAKDENKYGLAPKELIEYLTKISSYSYIKVKGLMTIAPYTDDPEEVRPYFTKLRKLSEKIKSKQINNIQMKELSMGMSNDFKVAIEEGATILRIGSAIFGPRDYN